MRGLVRSMLAAGLLALAWPARAQEVPDPEPTPDPRPHLQVLRDPYDLASFYRSSGSGGAVGGWGFARFGYRAPGFGFREEAPPPRSVFFGPHWISGFGAGWSFAPAPRPWSGWGRGLGDWDGRERGGRPRPAPRPE